MFLLLVNISYGATVHGDVYAWDTLEKIGATVEVDSVPKQLKVVAEGGEYSFELNEGSYIISAVSSDGLYAINETIEILEEGDYVFDLILWYYDDFFDKILEDDTIGDDDFDIGEEEKDFVFFVLVFIVVIVGVLFFYFMKKRKHSEEKLEKEILETDEDLEKVLESIKENKGRITQKDIRKKMMPLSEAKVSLLITELEDKGVIKRIKKGRGNVIILKR